LQVEKGKRKSQSEKKRSHKKKKFDKPASEGSNKNDKKKDAENAEEVCYRVVCGYWICCDKVFYFVYLFFRIIPVTMM